MTAGHCSDRKWVLGILAVPLAVKLKENAVALSHNIVQPRAKTELRVAFGQGMGDHRPSGTNEHSKRRAPESPVSFNILGLCFLVAKAVLVYLTFI